MIGKGNLTTIVLVGIVFLLAVLSCQQFDYQNFFIARERINIKEPFEDNVPAEKKEPVLGVLEMAATGPADANIALQRKPYNLLNGVLPDDEKNRLSGLSAQRCYEGNFLNRLQKSSHRQVTNNYQRYNPDSCSAPFTELVTSFYKVEPLPAA